MRPLCSSVCYLYMCRTSGAQMLLPAAVSSVTAADVYQQQAQLSIEDTRAQMVA